MGQGQSEPSREGAAGSAAADDTRWHCAKIEGVVSSTQEITVTPSKKELGLDRPGPGGYPRRPSGTKEDFLPPENGVSGRRSGHRQGPSGSRPRSSGRRGGDRPELDLASLSSVGDRSVRSFTGPHSEGSFISGLSARSSGSRGSPPLSARSGDIDDLDITTAAMRAREQNEWDDSERDKNMFLKRIKAQVEALPTPSRPSPAQDSLRPLPPSREAPRRSSGSDAGYSDRTHERHRGKQRGHFAAGGDNQSERSARSAKSGFSLSSFRSAISGVSDRYKGRDPRDDRHRGERSGSRSREQSREPSPRSPEKHRDDRSGGSRGSPRGSDHGGHRHDREDSISYHSPREYDEFDGDRDRYRDRDRYGELAVRDRDRDDNSSGRGSRRSGSRRSLSRSGSIGADARGPGRTSVPQSRRGPGMSSWMKGQDQGDAASSHRGPSERGVALYRDGHREQGFEDRAPDSIAANDLEAKLKNAQKNLMEVQMELEEHKKLQKDQNSKKKKEMPGGNAVQHALMQDLRDLRDYCVEVDKAKEEQETQAKRALGELKTEQEQRKEDIRARQESEKLQAQLQDRIDTLTDKAKDYDSQLDVTSKDTAEMKKLLTMIQSERDETLNLLRRAVAQKERMKGDRQRETKEATDKFEDLVGKQKSADNKVRELLNSVDTLLGKFSLDKEDPRSKGTTARSTVAVQLELMKIRDSIRFLLKANESGEAPRQAGGQMVKKGKA